MIKLLLLCFAWIVSAGSIRDNKAKQNIADAIFDKKRGK